MLRLLPLLLILLIDSTNIYGQPAMKKVHAYKMQVLYNTDGSSKGWSPCDFFVEFSKDKSELKSIAMSANNKDLKIVINKKKGTEKFNYSSYYSEKDSIEYRWYEAYDDLTAEDVRLLIGYKAKGKELNPISITMIYMLSTNFIGLTYP